MKSAGELIDALHKAGATLVIEDGKPRVRGATVPDALLMELKLHKAAVVDEWNCRQAQHLDRYSEVPDADAPMLGRDVNLKPETYDAVIAYVMRQPRPVHAWVMKRTGEYHALGVEIGPDEQAACLDVLAWQRNTSVKLAVEWLSGIDECAASSKPM